MSDPATWLTERLASAPEALVDSMVRALPPSTDPLPDALVEGALRLYGEVARGAGGREDALPLLAADALFTHAFEAQAELDIDGIPALVGRCARGLEGTVP